MVRPETSGHNYLMDDQDLLVTAIVDSPIIPLKRANLKVLSTENNGDSVTASMNITSIAIPFDESNSTSRVSVTVPSEIIHGPAVEFWIIVVTEEGVVKESNHHIIGVKPDYDISGSIEMDAITVKVQGTHLRPTAHVINTATGPIYGTLSLLVDGKPVQSESNMFEPGITIKELDWLIPKNHLPSRHDIQSSLQVYDKTYVTSKTTFNSFVRTHIVPLSNQINILPVTDELGNIVARPALLYSSNSMGENFRFHVTAPDGTCVIGSESNCVVKESTKSHRGGLQNVIIDGQILRVRYSGSDNPLERFSITSSTPIVGNWNVELTSLEIFGQTASAQTDIWLKIKYRAEHNPSVFVSSE